jgi:hypothetical protein
MAARWGKSRANLDLARCRVENILKDQLAPCTRGGLRSRGGSEGRLVSKIVDSCQHPGTTAGEN